MTKMPNYNGQHIVVVCLICHSMMCKNTHHPCFCGWKAFKQDEKYQWVVNENNILGIIWWIHVFTGNSPNLRQGRLWKTFWHAQTKLSLGVTIIHLTLAWDTQLFWDIVHVP